MTSLQGHELVVHVFLVADDTVEGHRRLLGYWDATCDAFEVTEPVADIDHTPRELGPTSAPGGAVAARERRPGSGVHQLVLRRVHDVVVLSMISAPDPAERHGWAELEHEWAAAVGDIEPPRVIGTVRILQARLTDPAAQPDTAALTPIVEATAGSVRSGAVRQAPPLGPFAVWEASGHSDVGVMRAEPGPANAAWDCRADRRIVVVAGADRDAALSAWTWSRGSSELTPFARYLLHAAQIHYQLRVRAGRDGREPRARADAALAPLLRLCVDAAESSREPDTRALVRASAPLVELQARTSGLVDRATRLREMRRTVQIAVRNMDAHAGPEQPTGLFADDTELAAWATSQLDDDVAYLDARNERAREVIMLADQLVQRGLQARRERFNLAVTGVVGAIAMVLAAMQSLRLEFELPKPLLGGVVTALGALALLAPAVLLRIGVPDRGWPALLVGLAAGTATASVPWIALTAAANASGGTADVPVVVASSLVAGVIGAGLGWWLARSRVR